MAHRIQLILLAGSLAALAACGLDVVGVASLSGDGGLSDAGAGGDGGSSGLPVDAAHPPADCSVATCAALALAAPSFTPIAFGPATSPCPAGYDDQPVYENPKPQSGSCGCGDCTFQGASCATAHVQSRSGGAAQSCTKNEDATDFTTGRCLLYGGMFTNSYASEVTPAPAAVGTCRAPAEGVRDHVDVTAERMCTRHADTCAGSMCELPTGLEVCLVSPGTVDCPTALPAKHVVAPDFALTCDACSCKPTAACTGGMSWWRDSSSCSGTATGTIAADTCTQVNNGGISSLRWDATLAPQTCATKAADKATATLTGPMTVCCAK